IGGTGSNHCRAVAALGGRLGLQCVLVVRRDRYFDAGRPRSGNLLLNNLFGARVFVVSQERYRGGGSAPLLQEGRERLARERPERKIFAIPVGGSVTTGVWGYIMAMDELSQQLARPPDVIFFASGSGGTAAGGIAC